MARWNNKKTDKLAGALVSITEASQMKNLLRDLMTESEIIEFGNRLEAAQMLNDGVSYSSIIKKTGLSSTTIARISKWLFNGMGGYGLVLHHAHNRSGGKSP